MRRCHLWQCGVWRTADFTLHQAAPPPRWVMCRGETWNGVKVMRPWSIFSERLDLTDVIGTKHPTTVFTQPALSAFTIQASIFWLLGYTFCSLVPRPHPPQCILLFVHHFLSTLVSRKKKNLVAWSSEHGIHAVVPQAAYLLALFSPFAILLFLPSVPTFRINNYQVNQSYSAIPLFHILCFTVSRLKACLRC